MMRPRVLALAGMVQSLKLVRQIAETGHADTGSQRIVLDSVFRIDADSVDAVYGGRGQLRPGLMTMREHLVDRGGDELLPKLGMAILQIERRFVGDPGMADQVVAGLRALESTAERQGSIHPEVIARLGQLYADTISTCARRSSSRATRTTCSSRRSSPKSAPCSSPPCAPPCSGASSAAPTGISSSAAAR